MQITVNGLSVFAATGGRAHLPDRPTAVFLHGAGLDHTVWAAQSRWLSFHGWNVLALDLPGHGASAGVALHSIHAMAEWVIAVLDALKVDAAAVIGHSMGSLVSLAVASMVPARVSHLALIGTAAAMPVHADLLAAARDNHHDAIDMVNLWGYGYAAGIGASPAPGLWMVGLGERILERAPKGVLFTDLDACNNYRDGLAHAAKVTSPTVLICGEKDQMTPLRQGRALSEAIIQSRLVIVPGAGHMLMAESPDVIIEALGTHLDVKSRQRR